MVRQDSGSREEMLKQIRANKEQSFPSRFGFLNEVKGLRKGCSTGLLGTTGSGKSSIAQAIVADTLEVATVLLLLSEDKFKEYQIGIALANPQYNFKNLKYLEQDSIPEELKENHTELFKFYEDQIVESGAQLVIWDNPTTSPFYSSGFTFRQQEQTLYNFRRMAQRLNIAFIYLLHTQKDVRDNMGRLIEGEDVRGSNQSFQLADYFFIFQKFMIDDKFYPFIRIRKHRYHRFLTNFFFILTYKDGTYLNDTPVEFKAINDAFLRRNYLGKK